MLPTWGGSGACHAADCHGAQQVAVPHQPPLHEKRRGACRVG